MREATDASLPLRQFVEGIESRTWKFVHLLQNIDTAVDTNTIAECTARLGGSEIGSILRGVRSREQMASYMHRLREYVQCQYMRQMQCIIRTADGDPPVSPENVELLQRLMFKDRPDFTNLLPSDPHFRAFRTHSCNVLSRHITNERCIFAGQTLASVSLLYGDGKSPLSPEPLPEVSESEAESNCDGDDFTGEDVNSNDDRHPETEGTEPVAACTLSSETNQLATAAPLGEVFRMGPVGFV